jgi:hypothetical protein
MKSKHRINPYIFAGFFVCSLLVLGSFKIGVLKGSVAKRQVNFPIQSRVPNIVLIDTTADANSVHVNFRNDSLKTITAYSTLSGGVTYRNELLGTSDAIAPGAIFSDGVRQPQPTYKGLFLVAVVYEDGTTSGEPKFINQILAARAGRQAQLERIIPILEEGLVTTKNVTLKEKWKSNTDKLKALPTSKEGESFEYNAALEDEKNLVLIKIKDAEQIEQQIGEEDARKEFTYLKKSYERKHQVLQDVLKKRY